MQQEQWWFYFILKMNCQKLSLNLGIRDLNSERRKKTENPVALLYKCWVIELRLGWVSILLCSIASSCHNLTQEAFYIISIWDLRIGNWDGKWEDWRTHKQSLEWDTYFVGISGWRDTVVLSFDGFNGTNECGEDGRKMRKESFTDTQIRDRRDKRRMKNTRRIGNGTWGIISIIWRKTHGDKGQFINIYSLSQDSGLMGRNLGH